jgi:hypothetical protein
MVSYKQPVSSANGIQPWKAIQQGMLAQEMTLRTCTRKVSGSNLGRNTDYPDLKSFRVFFP